MNHLFSATDLRGVTLPAVQDRMDELDDDGQDRNDDCGRNGKVAMASPCKCGSVKLERIDYRPASGADCNDLPISLRS